MKRVIPIVLLIVVGLTLVLPLLTVEAATVRVKLAPVSPRSRLGMTGANYISPGLRTFAKGMKVFWTADTLTGPLPTFTWSIVTQPAGSTATIVTYNKDTVALKADMVGQYIVKADMGGGLVGYDTVFASTYMGWPTSPVGCQTCHPLNSTPYAKTNHATIAYRGFTGQLEIDSTGKGAYGKTCVRCHTTGWESITDNGNYGFIANQTKWDSTWWKPLPYYSGDYWVVWKDQTLWNDLKTNYPTLLPVATIGCETCHGPGKDHNGDKTKISTSYESGICMQCHDSPKGHSIGYFFSKSGHYSMPLSAVEANRTACFPCHNGSALPAYIANSTTPNYSKVPFIPTIACQACHDPHDNTNPFQLRTMKAPPLMNKFVIPDNVGGTGHTCMNCHRTRYDATAKVTEQARVFGDRFYAHYSEQTDMFFGTNAYEFGKNLSGLTTHLGTENACVTCHMADRPYPNSTSGIRPNHQFTMTEDNGGKDIVTACKSCHGEITEFNEIIALDDYDGNNKTESAMTEVQGLMDKLKLKLPKNTAGDVVTRKVDSMIVKNDPLYKKDPLSLLGAMYNYWFVMNDFSKGIHNTKYTVAILKAAYTALTGPVSVEAINQDIPRTYSLGQNYPNPFNPSTSIQFSVPRSGQVRINVFNTAGALVATLVDGQLFPGNYATNWNGRDAQGQMAGSGVYFYRMEVISNGQLLNSTTRKMVMLK